MKVAVLLSGSGVYDGSEIHEAVFSLLSLKQNNLDYICVAPDISQYHVVNHVTGDEIKIPRNVLEESARISRGEIISLSKLDKSQVSSIVMPGGFGAVKNFSKWAFSGPDGNINTEIKDLILHCLENKKPIVSLCISPVLVAKSTEGSDFKVELTLGTTKDSSPYEIEDMHKAVNSIGSVTVEKSIDEICFDDKNNIITAPCYMMNASIDKVYNNVKQAIDKLSEIL